MARDYKPRQAQGRSSGLLLGVCIGFVLGVAVAAAIAAYFLKSPVPFLERQRAPERQAPVGQNLKDAPKAAANDGKPRFDFYRILPGQEEAVTSEQLKQAAAKEKAGKAEPDSVYFLQAGAFQSPADADNLKARLALLGLEASVEPTTIPDKGVWYRVRLGPYSKVEDINKVRGQLASNGIDASLVKFRDPKTDATAGR
jgi:cell division protein FtsN